jgi:hypothetical protein
LIALQKDGNERLLASRKKANNIKFNNVAKVETYQMAKALVAQGAGVSIIDEITARSTGHRDVVAWKLYLLLEFNIALLHLESELLSIVTQHFVEHLKTAVDTFLKAPTRWPPLHSCQNCPGWSAVRISDLENKMVYSRMSEQIRIAGFADFVSFNTERDKNRIQTLLETAHQLAHDLAASLPAIELPDT